MIPAGHRRRKLSNAEMAHYRSALGTPARREASAIFRVRSQEARLPGPGRDQPPHARRLPALTVWVTPTSRSARRRESDGKQRVSNRQLGCDLGDREARSLRASAEERETRGFISITVMRPFAGLTANCTCCGGFQRRSRASRQWPRRASLVFAVAKRLRRSTVMESRMHTHRIEILNRADDDDVVRQIPASPPARIPSPQHRFSIRHS